MPDEHESSRAPLIVFGGMALIGISTLLVVAIGHCQREEPYLDPELIKRRVQPESAPSPSPAPGEWSSDRQPRRPPAGDAGR